MKRAFIIACLLSFVSLVSISRADKVAAGFAPKKRCQLHGNILKRDVVPVRVNMLDGLTFEEDEKKYFPNANLVVWVGDYPPPAQNEVREVWYCEKCRQVRERWCKKHDCLSLTSREPNNVHSVLLELSLTSFVRKPSP